MLLHIVFVLSGLIQIQKRIQNPFQNAFENLEKEKEFLLSLTIPLFRPAWPCSHHGPSSTRGPL
jgi:hypothetical protein